MAAISIATYGKGPTEVLAYGIDFAGVLDAGETILSVVWTVPGGITKDSQANTSTVASLVLSGGTLASSYLITATVTTTPSTRKHVRTIRVDVIER